MDEMVIYCMVMRKPIIGSQNPNAVPKPPAMGAIPKNDIMIIPTNRTVFCLFCIKNSSLDYYNLSFSWRRIFQNIANDIFLEIHFFFKSNR